MSFNLMDMVKGQISDQLVGQIGGLLGESPDKAKSAIDSAVPTLLAGMGEAAQNPNGADTLFNLMNRQDDQVIDNIGSMIGSNQSSELIESGTRGLGSLMGNKGVTSMIGGLSGHTGLGKGSSGSLLGMLAPLVMGQLKRKSAADGLNASGLASMLKGQGSNISAAMPQGMLKHLDAAGFGESTVSTGGTVSGGGFSGGKVAAGAAAAGAGVAAAAGTVGRGAGQAAGGAANAARGAAGAVSNTAGNVAGSARDMAGSAARGVSNTASGAVDATKSAAGAVGNTAGNVAGSAKDMAGSAARGVSNTASGAVDATKSAAGSAGRAVSGAAGSAADATRSAASGAADATRSAASGAADATRNAAGSVGRAAGNAADATTGAARGAANAAGSAASSAGGAVSRGVDAAGNKVGGAVNSTRQAANSATSSAAGATRDSSREIHESAKSGGGFWKWLLPLALAVLAWFGFKQLGGEKEVMESDVAGAASGVAESASGAAGDLGGKFTEFFGSTTETLGGITDADSATAALPQLESAGESLNGLTGMLAGADDSAKGAVSSAVEKGMEGLGPVVDKLKGDSGIWGVLEPVVGPMMETLKGAMGG